METSVAPLPSVRSAFAKLIDYAGLFPPAKLSMADALAEYRAAQRGPHAWMLGRFIIPVVALAAAAPAGQLAGEGLSVILDGGGDPQAWSDSIQTRSDEVAALRASGVAIEALEIPLPVEVAFDAGYDAPLRGLRDALQRAKLWDLPRYVEFARTQPWRVVVERAMTAAAHIGCGAKVRCGGVTPEAFPTVEELVDFIAAAADARVPFKATAGLHHPVRHLDRASGFVMHGFLNVLTAAALAPRVDRSTLQRIVGEEDPRAFRFEQSALHWSDQRIDAAELAAVRNAGFVAYGSCSFSEPVEDLTALGILAAS